jgi:hypothetical protein
MTVQEFLQLNEASISSAGASWDSCEALLNLNKARSALFGIDTFHGLVESVCMNACETIFMPWFGEDIKAVYRCKKIIGIAPGEYWVNAFGDCCGPQEGVTDTQTYSPVPTANSFNSRIGIRNRDILDNGRKVSISYYTPSGTSVTEDLILNDEIPSITEETVRAFISINKGSTSGMLYFYSVNSEGVCCEKLFPAYPLETNLLYRQYCISRTCCSSCSQIVVKVKRKYFPFTELNYNYPIDFPEHALALAMQAISEINKRTPDGYKLYQGLISSAINYVRKNTSKKQETIGDIGNSSDYPTIIEECIL